MLDFFQVPCTEPPLQNTLFGICDKEDGTPAHTNTNLAERADWGATVKNDKAVELRFVAVDKCVIQDDEYEGIDRCDGMLYSDNHLYFMELKNQRHHWVTSAKEQLEETIKLFLHHHPTEATQFTHKKAFACNKRRGHFQIIDNEENLRFRREYGFRLDVQAEIIVI